MSTYKKLPKVSVDRLAYTKREVAIACGVSIASVDRWMRDGKIKFKKVGHRVFFPVDEVVRFTSLEA